MRTSRYPGGLFTTRSHIIQPCLLLISALLVLWHAAAWLWLADRLHHLELDWAARSGDKSTHSISASVVPPGRPSVEETPGLPVESATTAYSADAVPYIAEGSGPASSSGLKEAVSPPARPFGDKSSSKEPHANLLEQYITPAASSPRDRQRASEDIQTLRLGQIILRLLLLWEALSASSWTIAIIGVLTSSARLCFPARMQVTSGLVLACCYMPLLLLLITINPTRRGLCNLILGSDALQFKFDSLIDEAGASSPTPMRTTSRSSLTHSSLSSLLPTPLRDLSDRITTHAGLHLLSRLLTDPEDCNATLLTLGRTVVSLWAVLILAVLIGSNAFLAEYLRVLHRAKADSIGGIVGPTGLERGRTTRKSRRRWRAEAIRWVHRAWLHVRHSLTPHWVLTEIGTGGDSTRIKEPLSPAPVVIDCSHSGDRSHVRSHSHSHSHSHSSYTPALPSSQRTYGSGDHELVGMLGLSDAVAIGSFGHGEDLSAVNTSGVAGRKRD